MHEVNNTLAWVIGIPFGFFLAVLLLINANAGLLFYVFAMPALQPLMRMTMAIPGSAATIALGGPLQTMILLAGICMVMASKVRLLKMPAVPVFLALWLIMGISIIEAPGGVVGITKMGMIAQYIPRTTDYVSSIKEWNRIGSFIFIYILAGLTFKGEKDIVRFVKMLFLSLPVPLAVGMYQFVARAGYVPDYATVEHYNRIMGTFGLGCFPLAIAAKVPQPDVAHNTFVTVLVETGIVGFSLATLFGILVFSTIVRMPRQERVLWLGLFVVSALCDGIDVGLPQGYLVSLWTRYGPLCSRPIATTASAEGNLPEKPACSNVAKSRSVMSSPNGRRLLKPRATGNPWTP